MIFGFWKKNKPRHSQPPPGPGPAKPRSSAKFGGMQERELQTRLELLVDAVLTRRRSVFEPAKALTKFNLIEQERFIASVDRLSLTSQELAFCFCQKAIPALAKLDDDAWEPWIDNLLKIFKIKGIDATIIEIEAFRTYQEARAPASGSVAFTDVRRILECFVQALSGRALKLTTAEQSYTDTETLFLPAHISCFPDRDENFRLYKALLVHQWAQTWFGTWRVDVAESLRDFSNKERALQLFHRLETFRLDACLERELPGAAREMALLRSAEELHPRWLQAQDALSEPDANVETSLDWLSQLYPLDVDPGTILYQGKLLVAETDAVIAERDRREREDLQDKLARLQQKLSDQVQDSVAGPEDKPSGFNITQPDSSEAPVPPPGVLEYSGSAVEIDPELQTLLDSIAQDHGEVPDYYLETVDVSDVSEEPEPDEALTNTANENTRYFRYDEWDHARQRYRRNWCRLHEQSVLPVAGEFVDDTLNKYRGLLKQLRRTFEALRQENRRLKRAPFGDDIDIDAIVESWSDTHSGLEASDRLFIQTRRQDREVAVMFMIDMSASTAGWINRVERESLVLLCEALERLGDRYAIYGFSGRGHRHCQCFHIKNFDEQYNDEVRNRINGIQPQDYTRLGAAIRHLGARLNKIEARTRLLITLSDGRPDDLDGYRGPYGIEDTRKALIEIRHMGIHPYCITIDTDAREYLPHMYGKTDFIIIDQVDKLPQRIADIYRRLTT